MKIAVIGSNMVDLITYIDRMPKEGETLEAPNFNMGCGGKGANQAVAASKLKSDVMMVSKVGDDLFGKNTIKNFKDNGINTDFVTIQENQASGVAPIFVDKNSKNSILIVKGANKSLSPKDIDEASEELKKCSLIVLQLEINLETVYYAIDFANKNNIPVLLNPAPAISDLDLNYVCKCDFLAPNESELEILTNKPVSTVEEIKEAARYINNKGVKNVIVTMGSKGVICISNNDEYFIEAHKVNAIDTTGAGDSFIGCFAHFYVTTKDILLSLKRATAFAALSVTKYGTQSSYPTKEEFESYIKENN
ncbi:ribokinase [Clostridium botulinum]|uniref:ribokinase n=1 Tax=Clostridium botulinum TaxID=1491 RepID=UPI0007743703|nr:ribokinase [Clostridium botulinum]MBY6809904.1 ribokinase [Clostridium botulinum]MBY6823560.1 ribokinase [Clostridium botulinum]MBY6834171.1 ribokinase [Clostridium botulinum]MBY6972518.1 ribokinase [Clostridium botulinum]MCS6103276.1 ribokinase [Clostridium botulinum]